MIINRGTVNLAIIDTDTIIRSSYDSTANRFHNQSARTANRSQQKERRWVGREKSPKPCGQSGKGAGSWKGSGSRTSLPPALDRPQQSQLHPLIAGSLLPSFRSLSPPRSTPLYSLNRKLHPTLRADHHRSGQTGGGWLARRHPPTPVQREGLHHWFWLGWGVGKRTPPASAESMATPRESLSRGSGSAMGPDLPLEKVAAARRRHARREYARAVRAVQGTPCRVWPNGEDFFFVAI